MTDTAVRQPLPHTVAPNGSTPAEAVRVHSPGFFQRLANVLAGRGFWALSDQAVLSLGNFITTMVLSNYLPSIEDFAIYGLILSTIFFLNSLHSSLISYPLLLKGAAADEAELRGLARQCARLNGLLLLPLSAVLAVATAVLGRPELIPWTLLALGCWQLQETMRRALMSKLRHRDAALGDAVSYLGQAMAVAVLWQADALTLQSALAAIAATSALGGVIQAFQLGVFRVDRRSTGVPTAAALPLSAAAREHWAYGRWLVAINFISLVTIQAMPWTLKFSHGQEGYVEAAHFSVLATILGVANPVVTSIVGLLVPAVAIAARSGGVAEAKRVAREYGKLGAVLLLPYFALLAIAPALMLRLFAHGAPLATPLRLFVVAYALTYPTQVLTALLNGLGHSRATLSAQVAFAGVTLVISLPLAAKFGLMGAVWGGLFPPLAYGVVSFWILSRIREAAPPPISEPRGFEVAAAQAEGASVQPSEGAVP